MDYACPECREDLWVQAHFVRFFDRGTRHSPYLSEWRRFKRFGSVD